MGEPNQNDINMLDSAISKASEITDTNGCPCYYIDIKRTPLGPDGYRALGTGSPFVSIRAILMSHTTEGKVAPNFKPSTKFQLMTYDINQNYVFLDWSEMQPNVDIIGCHLSPGGISRSGAFSRLIDKIESLKPKDSCKEQEIILIRTGPKDIPEKYIKREYPK
jgi:hypothetical protein